MREASSDGKLVVLYFGDYWETERCRRRQQLALRLAQWPEVEKLVYVELPVSLGELAKTAVGARDELAAARWRRVLRRGQRFSSGKIELVTPICVAPFFRFAARPDKAFVRWQTARLITRMLREVSARRLLLWISHPFAAEHVRRFGESLLCYDCTEDFGSFLEWGVGVRQMARENDILLSRQADLILVQTPAHLEEKTRLNLNTYLVPNGADLDRFDSWEGGGRAPVEIENLPRPILGYVGTYNCRVDGQLLLEVAQVFPRGSVVLVGRVTGDADAGETAALKKMPNVHFLGEKPYDRVPDYIRNFDVCLIPFRAEQDNRRGSPSKLFDYLSLGRPTVSTDLSGVDDFVEVVRVAAGHEAFLAAIDAALLDGDRSFLARCRALSRAHSWEARAEQVWQLLGEAAARSR